MHIDQILLIILIVYIIISFILLLPYSVSTLNTDKVFKKEDATTKRNVSIEVYFKPDNSCPKDMSMNSKLGACTYGTNISKSTWSDETIESCAGGGKYYNNKGEKCCDINNNVNSEGKCIACLADHYFDPTTQKCEKRKCENKDSEYNIYFNKCKTKDCPYGEYFDFDFSGCKSIESKNMECLNSPSKDDILNIETNKCGPGYMNKIKYDGFFYNVEWTNSYDLKYNFRSKSNEKSINLHIIKIVESTEIDQKTKLPK